MVHRTSLDHRGRGNCRAWPWRCSSRSAESSVRNSCRTLTKARSGRAARWRPAPAPPRASRGQSGAPDFRFFPRSHPGGLSKWARPDDGTDTTGFFNTEYFVDLKPKEQWRPVFHQRQGRTDRRDGPRSQQDSRRVVGIFAAHFRQRGGGRQRRERRAGREDLWRRFESSGRERRADRRHHGENSRNRRPGVCSA